MSDKLKNILITGASQGIGKALAFEYAEIGCNLALLSRNESALKEVFEKINSSGGKCYYKKCDVSNYDDVRKGIDYSLKELGSIDIAVLNSGISERIWMDEFKSSEFIKVFEVNTFGIARCLEFLIPLMKAQGYGIIAGITSLADVRGFPGSAPYCSSKSAASTLLESARVELKKYDIKVITVRPGFVKTAMTDKNEFKMPFLMGVDKAAKIIRKGIEKEKSVVQFPFPLVMLTRVLKFLPNWVYDWGINRARPRN
ncbi:MAG: SDR family NAD(P)-dependent oxidoreductase [Ignavibacteria bacterium]